MTPSTENRYRFIELFAVLFPLGAIYLCTLLPGVGYSGDCAKFQFVGPILGTPHATGYPLYILISWTFSNFIPIGSLAYKMNLLSAVFALSTCLTLYHIMRAVGISRLVAWSATLVFGLTPTFWSQALVAEVYTLNSFLLSLVLLMMIRWRNEQNNVFFFISVGIYALSFGNHLTMITILPALLVHVWLTDKTRFLDIRTLIAVTLLIIVGASQYIYLPVRFFTGESPYLELQVRDWGTFVYYVTGAQFKPAMFMFTFEEIITNRLIMFLKQLWSELHILLPLFVFGVVQRKVNHSLWLLWLSLIGSLVFALNYGIREIAPYFIPAWLILSIFVGLGMQRISEYYPERWWLRSLLVVLPIAMLLWNYDAIDQSDNVEEAARIEAVLEAVKRDAVIISPGYAEGEFLWYYLLGEDVQSEKNIFLLYHANPEVVRAYLQKDSVIYLIEQKLDLPVGLNLYSFNQRLNDSLRRMGFELTEVGQDLYLVQ